VFSGHGVDAHGKILLKKTVSRGNKLLDCFTNLPPCRIGMIACSGSHHWAGALRALGRDARILWVLLTRSEDYQVPPANPAA